MTGYETKQKTARFYELTPQMTPERPPLTLSFMQKPCIVLFLIERQ